MARRIETHFLAGPAGKLEALLEEPEDGEPRAAALVCHPHPKGGGTMHNKVVYRLARGMRKTGHVVLRFNFRGVNLSEGEFDKGVGELEDARTALAWLRKRYPELPFSIAGFSFGSRIGLKLGCELADVQKLIVAGFPTTYKNFEFLSGCGKNKIFIHSTNDEFGPRPDLEAVYATMPDPKQITWIEAEDHFFKGALDPFEQEVIRVTS